VGAGFGDGRILVHYMEFRACGGIFGEFELNPSWVSVFCFASSICLCAVSERSMERRKGDGRAPGSFGVDRLRS
jgi:hypothetical protein